MDAIERAKEIMADEFAPHGPKALLRDMVAEVTRLTEDLKKAQAGDHNYMQCIAVIRSQGAEVARLTEERDGLAAEIDGGEFYCPECQSQDVREVGFEDDFGSMECVCCGYTGGPGEDFPATVGLRRTAESAVHWEQTATNLLTRAEAAEKENDELRADKELWAAQNNAVAEGQVDQLVEIVEGLVRERNQLRAEMDRARSVDACELERLRAQVEAARGEGGPPFYAVLMRRWGNLDGHTYIAGIHSNHADATIHAEQERSDRAGKYEYQIWQGDRAGGVYVADTCGDQIEHITRTYEQGVRDMRERAVQVLEGLKVARTSSHEVASMNAAYRIGAEAIRTLRIEGAGELQAECICGHDGKLTSADCPRHGG